MTLWQNEDLDRVLEC